MKQKGGILFHITLAETKRLEPRRVKTTTVPRDMHL